MLWGKTSSSKFGSFIKDKKYKYDIPYRSSLEYSILDYYK